MIKGRTRARNFLVDVPSRRRLRVAASFNVASNMLCSIQKPQLLRDQTSIAEIETRDITTSRRVCDEVWIKIR